MIKVSDVLIRLSILLNDDNFVRWTKDELISWINDAVGEIIIRRPAAGGKIMPITLVAGVIQQVPAGVKLIFDITRNLPNGRVIHIAERQRLEESDPSWFSAAGTTKIKHYCYDDRSPAMFFVYPPASAGAQVEASVSMTPDKVSADTDEISIDDDYMSPIVSYAYYRALMKDAEEGNAQIAIASFQAFSEALGTKTQVSITNSATGAKP